MPLSAGVILAVALLGTGSAGISPFVPSCRAGAGPEPSAQQPAAQSATAKPVGTIKSIHGNAITLTPDSGEDIKVLVQDGSRLVRIAPGEKDLKNATPIQLSDLQAGDRILVRGKLADDSTSVLAAAIIVMKRSDVEATHQHEREDWQKRGVGGLVGAVDGGSGTISISAGGPGATKSIAVHVAKNTIVRRYAADSVKFDEAKPGTLDQIRAGDQLRARGARSAEGNELAAEEIVSGSFRNIAGTISSIDAGASTISVLDLITKKPGVVKLTAESQLRKLPPMIAQRIAVRLKGLPADAPPGTSGPGASPAGDRPAASAPSSGPPSGGSSGAPRAGGAQDLQQMLTRIPAVTIADFQKGDAVMIVSTQASASGQVTAITLLGGVEPILVASPKGGQGMILTPWSLGEGGGEIAAP
jgi:hypothetical protein